MNVAVLSFFRNSAWGQAQRFMQQAANLRDALSMQGDRMRVIAVHGDSSDNTEGALIDAGLHHNLAVTLVRRDHGGPVFGSTESADRLRALSYVGNGGLQAILPQDDAVFYVESDLVWLPQTVVNLLKHVQFGRADVVAPLVFAGDNFYDIFVFRKNGQRFGPFYPYHPELNHGGLTDVDSVGSGFVMRGEVGRKCRIKNDNVLMGFCQDAWDNGFNVRVDATQRIYHP